MIVYKTFFTNTNGVDFPDTESRNASGPSATDGTEFVKGMIDDMWGARQALMNRAGLTPDGVSESDSASQFVEALIKGFAIGPGIGVTYWKDGDPAVNGDRVLLLNGQGVLRSSFPDLDAAVYVGDGNNAAVAAAGGGYYHADDAAGTIPNTAGIYLILPETRGYVLRGLDLAASVDPDGAGRFLGDNQLDALQGHLFYNGLAAGVGGAADIYGITTNEVPGLATSRVSETPGGVAEQMLTSAPKTNGVDGTPRISSESRMVNVSVVHGITY